MGFGTGPYGLSPFGTAPISFEEEPETVLVSSEAIDGKLKDYVLDAEGNPDGMRDVAQRVYLLSVYALKEKPGLIGPDFNSKREAALRGALASLTSGPEPSISVDAIETTNRGDTAYTRIVFTDLTNGAQSSVTI